MGFSNSMWMNRFDEDWVEVDKCEGKYLGEDEWQCLDHGNFNSWFRFYLGVPYIFTVDLVI